MSVPRPSDETDARRVPVLVLLLRDEALGPPPGASSCPGRLVPAARMRPHSTPGKRGSDTGADSWPDSRGGSVGRANRPVSGDPGASKRPRFPRGGNMANDVVWSRRTIPGWEYGQRATGRPRPAPARGSAPPGVTPTPVAAGPPGGSRPGGSSRARSGRRVGRSHRTVVRRRCRP